MATQSTTSTNPQSQELQGTARGIGSPVTNEAYNVVTALQAKLEGLEAYRKYANDGNGEIWQRLTQTEVETVRVLCDELERLVREGRFQLREPGRANA